MRLRGNHQEGRKLQRGHQEKEGVQDDHLPFIFVQGADTYGHGLIRQY